MVVLDEGAAVTAVPLQANTQNRMLFSEIFENASTSTGLSLVNTSSIPVNADVFLVQGDGITVGQNTIAIPPFSKYVQLVHNLFPDAINQPGSYMFVRSSVA